MKYVFWLIHRDVLLELRQPHVLSGIFLHTLGSVWIAYLAFKGMVPANTWNGLIWIILLFSAIHASQRAFGGDSMGRRLYYYTLANPRHIILAKIIYNTLLILFLSIITSSVFILFNGNAIVLPARFIIILLLGSTGLGGILTFTSAIAAQELRNFSLMSILSLPIVAPLLLLLINLSASTLQPMNTQPIVGMLMALLVLDSLSIAMAWVLFPYLWKE